jgi:CysZ protein
MDQRNSPQTLSKYPWGAFVQGAALPLHGAAYLLGRPKLWLWVIIPVAVNLVIFTALIWWGFSELSGWLSDMLQADSAWYWKALIWIAKALFWLVVLIIVYFIFTPVALIVAAPFNDLLAESVERSWGFSIEDNRPFLRMITSEALYAIVSEIKKQLVFISVFVLLLVLNLVPLIGATVYAVAAFLCACWCAALEFTGYAMDRRHLSFRQKWRLVGTKVSAAAGFGVVTVFLLSIPFLNILAVSVSAVAGTMLFGMIREANMKSLDQEN